MSWSQLVYSGDMFPLSYSKSLVFVAYTFFRLFPVLPLVPAGILRSTVWSLLMRSEFLLLLLNEFIVVSWLWWLDGDFKVLLGFNSWLICWIVRRLLAEWPDVAGDVLFRSIFILSVNLKIRNEIIENCWFAMNSPLLLDGDIHVDNVGIVLVTRSGFFGEWLEAEVRRTNWLCGLSRKRKLK